MIGISRICHWPQCLLLIAALSMPGCAFAEYVVDKDKNGNLPDDAVRNFIKLVQANDYKAAQQLWYGESMLVVKLADPPGQIYDGRIKFEDFCARYKPIDLKSVKISKAYKGKSGFSGVDIDWQEGGKKNHDSFGLKIIDGEWKMERGYYW